MTLPIKNLRSSTASKRPNQSNLSDGQLALNTESSDPAIYIKSAQSTLVKIAPTYIGNNAPNSSPGSGGVSGNSKGETWLDTTYTPHCLKVWSGSAWVEHGRFDELYVNGPYKAYIVPNGFTSTLDCSLGNYFTLNVSSTTTIAFSNVPTGCVYAMTVEITHTGGNVQWPSAVKFPANSAPSLTSGKTHLFMLVTDDGGSRWRAQGLADYDN